ncbi:MAG TPA: GGDEF domain-containing phosphodiesterase, partial [Ottowia sp.]|nr:GGDEF domain-containing phosphodiesterase [Ottowia sp.]
VARKVLARLIEPFDLDGHRHHCTTSIGVTLFGAGPDSVAELLQQADLAMYQAKHMGRNTVAFFDPAMQAALNASTTLVADLRAALGAERQLELHFQPQFDRARRITGVEALLRWQHPQRGLVGPTEFIPVAEDSGLIVPLGLWALTQACRQLARWQAQPHTAALSVSVNVSAQQFRHPDFVDQVTAVIRQSGAPAARLRLELTESLLADRLDITLAQMDRLRQLGVALSLDDFGTGYSSLAYLKRLPLDQLKIDRAFVADVLTDSGDAAIASAIIAMAHSLGLKVVAEGVETEAQQRLLSQRGCDGFQGFLLAPPMPAPQVEHFIARHTTAGAA